MRLKERNYQTVMQMKGLSPVKQIVIEVDTFHGEGRQHYLSRKGEAKIALSGSETMV
jgi:hypothetical protein